MCGNGNKITGPIRDVNPCYKCQKPTRHLGCHDTCKRHKEWKAEIERVNANRREYARQSDLGWRKK